MERYQLEELEIIFDCAGRDDWGKFSFPVWYGIPVKMNWREYRYDFNLRGGLKKVSGGPRVWPEPQDVLKRTDGNDLINYNSLMLGQNNALAAGEEILVSAAEMAYDILNLSASYHRGRPNLFMFGSVDSFLEADHSLLDRLERLPYRTSINVGMESFDQETLDRLGKPLQAEKVREAFRKMQAVNRCWPNIAVSCNFVLGGDLPSRHLEAIKTLLAAETTARDRGAVYLSPLIGASRRREILKEFREIKMISPLPVFIYLAQRL
ncbi:MAG: hypothetical protein AAB112_04665 [Thermodesulfobacteriota bacterium]